MTPNLFVERLLNHYGSPEHVINKKALKDDYAAALNGTDAKVLQEASDRLLKLHVIPIWPTIGECIRMVNDVAEEWARQKRSMNPEPLDSYRKPTKEERERVAALVSGLKNKLSARGTGRATQPREDWSKSSKPAWDERMATSETAQQLSIPRNLRRS